MQLSDVQPYDSFKGINKDGIEAFYVVLDVPEKTFKHGFDEVILMQVGKPRAAIKRIKPDVFQMWLQKGLLKKFTA